MFYYVEILHPDEKKVLWHYFVKAPSKELAEKEGSNKFIDEQSNGILIETGGLFIVTSEEITEENIHEFGEFFNKIIES